ncbi:MAG: hypothetical protein M0Z28_28285 [Rhodospirillales bacterium]|nr:hypothetical protein [Rhodospirillales bacterium]
MAMGMAMGKKMMGQGRGPMAMRQRMMAPTGSSEEAPQMPMQTMMGMCSDMLGVMAQTATMAAFATPELQQAFGAWLKDLEGKAEAAVAEGEKDEAELATALGIDADSARYVLGRLAASGKVTLVARPRG